MRVWIFAGLLAVASVLVVNGVADLSRAAAWIVAGVLVALWSWLVLAE